MFVMRWLVAATTAAFCELVNQLVAVCLSFCLSVSPRRLIIQGVGVSVVHPPSVFCFPLPLFTAHLLCETSETSGLRKDCVRCRSEKKKIMAEGNGHVNVAGVQIWGAFLISTKRTELEQFPSRYIQSDI